LIIDAPVVRCDCPGKLPEGARKGMVGNLMGSHSLLEEVRFLTVAEVAALMRVSKMTVYRLVHAGDLAAVRVGRSFRVPENAVQEYLATTFKDAA
jgi:excisionase family DNA binding protein